MPLRDVRCTRCTYVEERLELTEGDALVEPCVGCGGVDLEVLPSRFAIRMAAEGTFSGSGGNWDQYDVGTLRTYAGAKEAAYEVARESGIGQVKAREAAAEAADGMREAGARLIEAQGR